MLNLGLIITLELLGLTSTGLNIGITELDIILEPLRPSLSIGTAETFQTSFAFSSSLTIRL